MAAGFAEDCHKQIGGAVDDGGRVGESVSGVDIAVDGDDFGNAVQRAMCVFENRKLRKRAGAGGGIALFDGAVAASGAGDKAIWPGRDDSGQIKDGADLLGRTIRAAERRDGWQLITERGEDLCG